MLISNYASWIPILKTICPCSSEGSVSHEMLRSMSTLATQTAHLINVLVREEVAAPTHSVAMQTLVMRIQDRLEASDIDPHIKSSAQFPFIRA
jgi:hypothetical protein